MISKLNSALIMFKAWSDTFINEFKNKEKGAVDIVAIIILIAIAVAVALIFREQLTELVKSLMGNVISQANEAVTKK